LFADNLWIFGGDYIRTGGFDRFLVRPVNPLFHLLADRFNHDGIGEFALGALLVGKATMALGIAWTPLKVLYLVIAVLSGGLIVIALNLITCVSAFWIMDAWPVTLGVYETNEFAKYPLSIYGRGVTLLMTWVIPYGFASYYPAKYILGRDGVLMGWLAPVVAAVLFTLAYRFWLFGLRHYSGTGS
jgi:ABC-2 type transport system permease protein